ncbi:MAG TPA: UDP-N-acetylmuramoyl-L-alanine--D-glutamate ligase [Gammaproteobacteria bacterium]|nr:UDP-N-acetylmuramoyl-L-alanine--D-glutamate ligase [Gammaproteobacteria bacterium]
MADTARLGTAGDGAPRTVVVGLGRTGLSVVRYLHARGVPVAVTDSRLSPPGLAELRRELPDVPVGVGGFDAAMIAVAERVVLSPGVARTDPALAPLLHPEVPVLGDIELFARAARAAVAAITGSNGKSTVTSMLGSMAAAAGYDARVGGNIGTPALELLRRREPDLYVLELSSFQLETTVSLDAAAAVVLNVSPDHLDRHGSLQAYAAAKQRIYAGSGTAVINADDPLVAAMVPEDRAVLRFRLGRPGPGEYGRLERRGEPWLARGDEPLLRQSELAVSGLHNVANALAALAMGEALGLARDAMLRALGAFAGLAHRTQLVGASGGVRFFDDSKGTNVGASVAAIRGMPGPVVLIAGGEAKDGDFSPLREAARDRVHTAVLIGRDAPLIEAALAGVAHTLRAPSMEEAVRLAAGAARPGDSVLLSPACASFDMFRDYQDRGERFARAVRELTG